MKQVLVALWSESKGFWFKIKQHNNEENLLNKQGNGSGGSCLLPLLLIPSADWKVPASSPENKYSSDQRSFVYIKFLNEFRVTGGGSNFKSGVHQILNLPANLPHCEAWSIYKDLWILTKEGQNNWWIHTLVAKGDLSLLYNIYK